MQTASAGEVIAPASTWSYFYPQDAVDPAVADTDYNTTWFTQNEPGTSYDGPAFAGSGPGTLGYGTIGLPASDPNVLPVATDIGTPASGDRYTAYFATTFTLDAPAANVTALVANILADDGAFVYINGSLAGQVNVTGADTFFLFAIDHVSECTGRDVEEAYCSLPLDETLLVDGLNTIAVSIHNQSATSSDIGFDLSLTTTVIPEPSSALLASLGFLATLVGRRHLARS